MLYTFMELTYTQLNSSLLDTIRIIPGYQTTIPAALNLLYLSGCRPVEALDPERWTLNNYGLVELRTAKLGLVRTFETDQLPAEFVEALRDGRWLFHLIRISQVELFYARLWWYVGARVGEKEVKLYAFRYRYVKFLVRSGYSDQEIKTIMGWNSISLVSQYNNARIIL